MSALKGKTFIHDQGESYCCGEIIDEINGEYVLIKHFTIKTMQYDEKSTISVVSIADMAQETIREEGWERPKWNLFENKEKLVVYLAWLSDAAERRSKDSSDQQKH
jgi:hypothetical protein